MNRSAQAPFITDFGAGSITPWGLSLPPGRRVACYLRSTGGVSGDPKGYSTMIVKTMASAIKYVKAGYGDTIVVLPNHSESVADAAMFTDLKAGTLIIGAGNPRQSNAPTFRWTAAASSWLVAVADVTIQNLRLRMEGYNGITQAFYVTGAGCQIVGNLIQVASGASNKSTIVGNFGAGATDFGLVGNTVVGTPTHNVTNGFLISAAANNGVILDNNMIFSATAGNGVIHITGSALDLLIMRNRLYNTHTASTATILIDTTITPGGIICDNYSAIVNAGGTTNAEGIVFAGSGDTFKLFNNYTADTVATSGILEPVATT